jgi:hypothetical protein
VLIAVPLTVYMIGVYRTLCAVLALHGDSGLAVR